MQPSDSVLQSVFAIHYYSIHVVTKGAYGTVLRQILICRILYEDAGTWMADDDDDIAVTLDDSKTVVKVDPSTLTLNYATLTDASVAELDTLKGKVANNIAAAVTPTLQRHIAKLHKLDDVKVLGNSMKMEIGKTKFNFTKK